MFKREINWGPSLFLIIYQALLLVTLPFYFYYATVSWSTVAWSVILLYLTGMSITAGYHRYFSHKSYKTNRVVEAFLIFFGSMAGQGSVLRWSYDHRLHHAHVDTDDDPYNINKGFWYAHFLWILDKPGEIDKKLTADLQRNPLVMLQHRWYGTSMVVSNLMAFAFVGWLCADYWGAFFLAWWLRFFVLHHSTWFINSLAHTWGDRPFCQEQTAVNNFIIALLTFGEGYHNYHHVYANDYRNGIRWFHFDPTKWLVWTLNKLGLAWDLRRVDNTTISKRMVLERKNILLEKVKNGCAEKKEELELAIQSMSDQIVDRLAAIHRLSKEYKDTQTKALAKQIRMEIKELKRHIHTDWKEWMRLSRQVMRLAPA